MARIEPLVCALRLTARASAPPDATGGRAATSSTGMLVGGWAAARPTPLVGILYGGRFLQDYSYQQAVFHGGEMANS